MFSFTPCHTEWRKYCQYNVQSVEMLEYIEKCALYWHGIDLGFTVK